MANNKHNLAGHFDDKHLDLEYRLRAEQVNCNPNGRNKTPKKNHECNR